LLLLFADIHINSDDSVDLPTTMRTIKESYRQRFAKYNPFYFDLGFQFDMNSWFPIKLVKVKCSDDEKKLFDELICEGLSKSGLVVITGT